MIDFTKYTLPELRAISAVMDDFMREHVNSENWKFVEYVCSTAREAIRAESAAIEQQAKETRILNTYRRAVAAEREAAQAEAEKVDRIVQACVAGAPPAEEPDEQSDLQALVNTLSQCSDRLAALALVEDRHFEESSEMDAFIKSTVLRNANRSIIDMLADISVITLGRC